VGQEDVALGIDHVDRLGLERAPNPHLHAVSDGDEVVGVELGRAFTGEGAAEQLKQVKLDSHRKGMILGLYCVCSL
jgi:hypothetical protein